MFKKLYPQSLVLSFLLFFILVTCPAHAEANLSSFIVSKITNITEAAGDSDNVSPIRTISSQNVALLLAPTACDPGSIGSDAEITIVNNSALMAESGPMGTMADIDEFASGADTISVYVVRSGDSLSKIAKMFGVSVNTIIWGNDLKNAKDIRPGQELVILPVTGIKYVIKKGDTIAGIAKKYKGDADEIYKFNNIEKGAKLAVGTEIIIPNGEVPVSAGTTIHIVTKIIPTYINDAIDSLTYFMRPVVNGRRTQGIHGKNGIDIAPSCKCVGREPVLAAAAGQVLVARNSGWNGGYGNYVVITHPNGTQTLYGHMYSVSVSVGQRVDKGDQIGLVGSSGNSTGPHVHFEIRGAENPF